MYIAASRDSQKEVQLAQSDGEWRHTAASEERRALGDSGIHKIATATEEGHGADVGAA